MAKKYFDLSSNTDLSCLTISSSDQYNCVLSDGDGEIYAGFRLAQSAQGNVVTICDVDFHKSDTDSKYQPRLAFKKTNQLLEIKEAKSPIRIPFLKGKDGYREFWKMIAFLYKFKEMIDFGDFTEYFSVTDKNVDAFFTEILNIENKDSLLRGLQKLSNTDLDNIGDLVSTTSVKKLLTTWKDDKDNSSESFWQNLLKENTYVLSQVFSCPFIFIQDEFHCGGKTGNNRGGSNVDFIYENECTQNTAFIEIKTPDTKLLKLSSSYRGKEDADNNTVYSVDPDLTGGVNQLLNQRNLFIQKKDSIDESNRSHSNFKCVLIAGSISTLSTGQKKSFELYRSSLRGVEIIAYDELYQRLERLLRIFEGK